MNTDVCTYLILRFLCIFKYILNYISMSVRCLALIAVALLSLGLGQLEQVFKLINRLDRLYKRFIAFWKYVSTNGRSCWFMARCLCCRWLLRAGLRQGTAGTGSALISPSAQMARLPTEPWTQSRPDTCCLFAQTLTHANKPIVYCEWGLWTRKGVKCWGYP